MKKEFGLTIKGIIIEQENGSYELDWTDFGDNPIDVEELIITAIEPYCTGSVCGDWDAIVEEVKGACK